MGIKYSKIKTGDHICSNNNCTSICCKSYDNASWKKYCNDCLCKLCHENCVVSKNTKKSFNDALILHIFCEKCINEFSSMCDKYY